MHVCISIIMRASYDSIDNKQKMCEKVNKDITFIQFFHSTELFKIFFSLLTLQLLFCKKLVGREKTILFLILTLLLFLFLQKGYRLTFYKIQKSQFSVLTTTIPLLIINGLFKRYALH